MNSKFDTKKINIKSHKADGEYVPPELEVPAEELYAMDISYKSEENSLKPEKTRKKRRKKHYFLKFICLAALLAGLFFYMGSSTFDVTNIEVKGNNYFTANQIINMTDFRIGKNTFKSGLGKSSGNILSNSYFSSANIRRILPDRVEIVVEERIAAGVFLKESKNDEKYIVFDKKGTVLENKAGSRRDKKKNLLTKVMGVEFEKAETGEILEAKKAYQLEEMLALINAKNKSALRVSKIDLTNTTIKMYFNAHFYAQGTYKNLLKLTKNGNLKKVVGNLKMNGKSSGIITIGSKDYIAYSSKFE